MRIVIAAMLVLITFCSAVPAAQSPTARQILDATGCRGGLVVHVGCGDGKLACELRAGDAYLVHGLDTDAGVVAAARKYIRSKGLYGPVSVDTFDGRNLPYADELANLVIVEQQGALSMDELMRVLRPLGVAYVQVEGTWTKTVKPWPDDIDDWTHYLHDASNNAVAADRRVATPRRLRWQCEPLWARSHEFNSSLCAMVSARGRLFYIFDEGLTGVTGQGAPDKWTLIARDAFNGVLLWKRMVPKWGPQAWKSNALRNAPPTVPRRLVADGDRVFVTLGYDAAVSVLHAATGEVIRTLEGTEGADELRFADGLLVLRRGNDTMMAVDPDTGKIAWQVNGRIIRLTPAVGGGRVSFADGKSIVCVSLKDGRPLWDRPCQKAPSLVLGLKDEVVVVEPGRLWAVEGDSGEIRWSQDVAVGGGELFAARGLLWHWQGKLIVGRDMETGSISERVDAREVFTPGHHPRCYQSKATENYIITPERGVEFVSITGGEHAENDWTRGPCKYGIMPANGLLYVPPNPCFCYPGVKVTGFNAYAPARSDGSARPALSGAPRLEQGPAYGLESEVRRTGGPYDWPAYRHDARRTGSISCRVGASLEKRWSVKLAGRLTQAVSVDSQVFVAAIDEHTVYAFSEAAGEKLWDFTAGGRIDSAPTVCGRMLLFGCADGYAYCLRRSDGAMVWRVRVAPVDQRIVAFGQLESPWRLHGSVLVEKGIAYMTAGRSSYLDGGIDVVAVAPETGAPVHMARVDTWSPVRVDAEGKPFVAGYHMEGTHSDVLVSEGGCIYLGQVKFDLNLKQQEVPYILADPDDRLIALDLLGKGYVAADEDPNADYEKHQRDWLERTQTKLVEDLRAEHGGISLGNRRMGMHVFSTAGFLDDSWFNRTYWMYAETWPGYYLAHRGAKTGQLLTVGPSRTYAVQAFPSRNLQSPLFTPATTGYLLFADDNDNEPVLDYRTRETTKGWGFGRSEDPLWYQWTPIRIRAMVLAGEDLYVAGPPDVAEPGDEYAAIEGRLGGRMWVVSADDGTRKARYDLDAPPVFDGMSVAGGHIYVSCTDGSLVCYAAGR